MMVLLVKGSCVENASQEMVNFRGLGDTLYSRGNAFDAVFFIVK